MGGNFAKEACRAREKKNASRSEKRGTPKGNSIRAGEGWGEKRIEGGTGKKRGDGQSHAKGF